MGSLAVAGGLWNPPQPGTGLVSPALARASLITTTKDDPLGMFWIAGCFFFYSTSLSGKSFVDILSVCDLSFYHLDSVFFFQNRF